MSDRDDLDGMCDEVVDPVTPDELVPWVVLFATVLGPDLVVTDRGALLARAAEWRALFGGGR